MKLAATPVSERRGLYLAVEARLTDPGQAVVDLSPALHQWPDDTLLIGQYAPMARAASLLHRWRSAEAVLALDAAQPMMFREMDTPYLLGLAQLAAGDPRAAAATFRAILAHTGFAYCSPYFLAHLGLARALRRSGDLDGSRREYAAFLDAWKQADADLPLLQQAKAEFADLVRGRSQLQTSGTAAAVRAQN